MSGDSTSLVGRLMDRVFPIMPDFFRMMCDQCDVAVKATAAFVQYMENGSDETLNEIRRLEKEADDLKGRNIDALYRAFATPMDREDILQGIQTLDYVINYTKITAREMGVLHFDSDKYILEMSVLLKEGVEALQRGYQKLASSPALADEDAAFARAAERKMEQTYRRALVHLYDKDLHMQLLAEREVESPGEALSIALDIFRTREIYRNMYEAADRLLEASRVLHDIVVKIA
ncbi:MAG: DUF47 family protein [Gammaproteobacteria bacterium]|nr:DUF47 family protein [Gammaproteobacteria bacterium]MCP5407660.1 DUF47 family protein [Chromatiaceae bacterium]MCP5409382.1 DUF47 family protein [Chromatiaceae bacterium]